MENTPVEDYVGCRELENLLDSKNITGQDRIRVYETMLTLNPFYEKGIEEKLRFDGMSKDRKEFFARSSTSFPGIGVINGQAYPCGPTHVAAILGEIAERYALSKEEREKLYVEIPMSMAEQAHAVELPDRMQTITDMALEKGGGIEAVAANYRGDEARVGNLTRAALGKPMKDFDVATEAIKAVVSGKAKNLGEAYRMLSGFGQLKTYLQSKIKANSTK